VLHADLVLADIAQRSDGVVTRAEAVARGVTDRQLYGRVATGLLERVFPEIYLHLGTPATPARAIRAAALASRGVISHRSAAHHHGLLKRPPPLPEVTVDVNRRFRHPGVRVHRNDRLDECDVMEVGGLRITTPVRALIDIGTKVTFVTLTRATERGIRAGLFSQADVHTTRRRLARRGRDGVGPVGTLLEYRSADLRPTESDLELLLWELIERSDLPMPHRQVEILANGARYRLDLAYPTRRIAIEGDGFGVHTERGAFERDRVRQNDLLLDGWLVLRFTWEQIVNSPEWVVRTIRRALDERRPIW
jgi:very-short-patch-repair endonuclease/predicted transcriptional regulator of viral defense system